VKRSIVIAAGIKSLPSGQNYQKNSLKECVLVNSALKIQCHIVKNTLIIRNVRRCKRPFVRGRVSEFASESAIKSVVVYATHRTDGTRWVFLAAKLTDASRRIHYRPRRRVYRLSVCLGDGISIGNYPGCMNKQQRNWRWLDDIHH